MEIWEALVLGLAQGLSEFLPISSSGHLLILEKCGIGQENLFFNIMLHVGTLFAVLIALRKTWIPLLPFPCSKKKKSQIGNLEIQTVFGGLSAIKIDGCVVHACLPTVALAFVFKLLTPSLLDGKLLGCGFVLTATLLYLGENFKPTKSTLLTPKTSILTGVLQGIAVLPGVSRSGATISALTLQGIDKKAATTFSFLLSIPIIIGSALYESLDLITGKATLSISASAVVVGVIAAFLSGLAAIKFFLKLIEKHSMAGFIVYTLLLGIAVSVYPFFV